MAERDPVYDGDPFNPYDYWNRNQDPAPTGPAYDPLRDPNANPGPEYFWNGSEWEYQGPGNTNTTTTPLTGMPAGPTPSAPPTGGPSGGGGGGGYRPPGWQYGGGNWGGGNPPDFSAPRWETPPEFVYAKQFQRPNQTTMAEDPGYDFRLQQGQKALEQSAAGKGVLRTGGTLKDLVNYGQNFATNEYANVYNRNFNEYKFDYDKEADIYARNYNLKRDVFDRNYKAAYDEYSPKLKGWEVNSQINARQQEALFNREYAMYIADRDAARKDSEIYK